MNEIKIGTLYLFKDGKKIIQDILISKEILVEVFSNPLYNNAYLNIYTDSNKYSLSIESIYEKYIKEGYTVMVESDYISFKEGTYKKMANPLVTCLLPVKVNLKDTDNIYLNFKMLEKLNGMENAYLESLENDQYGFNYRYYSSSKSNHILASDILKCLLRKKTNDLTDSEQKMFDTYENFNFEEVLTSDTMFKYPLINTSNAGVSIITKDKRYDSTLKSRQHGIEFQKIMNYLYPNRDKSKRSIKQLVLLNNDILIQICLLELIIWIPKNINNYQIKELQSILDQIYDIERKTHKKVTIWASECVDTDIRTSTEINDLEEYLNKKKEDNYGTNKSR